MFGKAVRFEELEGYKGDWYMLPLSTMKPWQQRVVDEREQLNKKLKLLLDFIKGETFSDVDKEEQGRLEEQMLAMTTYLNILRRRIEAFKN